MGNNQYFNFLGTCWDLLPQQDKDRMGETWQCYEQIVASVYQRFTEVDLNIAVRDLAPYSTERWLPYTCNSTNNIPGPLTSRYQYVYTVPYPRVVNIPTLQDAIRDDHVTTILAAGVDYIVDTSGNLAFLYPPIGSTLWAKTTLINDETPWNNFGYLMGIYQKNTAAYLAIIQGLWFAYWNGPTPQNIRSCLYLLFGLPVALEACTVTASTADAIQTTSAAGVTRTFAIPRSLVAIVNEGDSLTQFQPLVNGINVYDKISYPNFVTLLIGRAGIKEFLTENATLGLGDTDETKAMVLLLEHTYLPQVSVAAFTSSDINLGNVITFLKSIEPKSKAFFSQIIVGGFSDRGMAGEVCLATNFDITVTPNVDGNITNRQPIADLLAHETADNVGFNTDSDGFQCQELVTTTVYYGGDLLTEAGDVLDTESGDKISL